MGGGSRIRRENPLHPERHLRHGKRHTEACRSLVPRPEVVGGRFFAERAFKSLDNAKKCADENPGHSVFDEIGKVVYTGVAAFKPYLVRVSIADLNIRKGPSTDHAKTGKYTGIGTFTIVEEADGKGASKWGLLKSYQEKRNGWISLDYGKRV